MQELLIIQQKLNAPKNLKNSFGGYSYRSCEGILEAVKPLLAETSCTLTINDDIIEVGGRFYVKATAILKNANSESVSAQAFAREEESKKGMDASQITGSTSSYARKYALNGLFAIDDNKDEDSCSIKASTKATRIAPATSKKNDNKVVEAILKITNATNLDELKDIWANYKQYDNNQKPIANSISKRRGELGV